MKNIKHILLLLLSLAFIVSCEEENYEFGNLTAPTNLQITAEIVGQDTANPFGDGSGNVNFTATADNAITYRYAINGNQSMAPNGTKTYPFSNIGVNTYTVTVSALGKAGNATSATIDVEVLATYSAPDDLLTMLHGTDTKTWRVKAESPAHFGVGPAEETSPIWWAAAPFDKDGLGCYDDRLIFNADGTVQYVTNDTGFGQAGPMDQDFGETWTANPGGEYENYPLSGFSDTWTLTAPGQQETLTFGDKGYHGFYVGGDHSYQILERSANEMTLKTIGADGLAWFVILTSEEVQEEVLELVWSDEFETNGAPDPSNWTYDLGAGGWGNQEVQTYTDNAENVIVDNGSLIITAKANGSGYTSARLKTQGLQSFTYGKIEVRAKLPSSAGTWPAIWMLGSNISTVGWPSCGEIDIMEQTGWDKTSTLGTCHWLDNGSGTNASYGETTTVNNADTEFHLYSVVWSEESIKILLDDVPFMTLANSTNLPFYDNDFFFILNIAMGGSLGGTIDPNFTEDSMEIDYIRVYQ